MIGAVIGVGPRTGTSYVMKRLHEAGFDVHFVPDHVEDRDRVGGHFETPYTALPGLSGCIAKVWPSTVHNAIIERAVFLHREQDSQLRSIAAQMDREGITRIEPLSLLTYCKHKLEGFRAGVELRVATEEIDDRLDEIFHFFKEGQYHAHRSDHSRGHRGCWHRC